MQTVADMRGVGVKNREKIADVLCGRPLTQIGVTQRIGVVTKKEEKNYARVPKFKE